MTIRTHPTRALFALLFAAFSVAACDDTEGPTFPTTPVVLPDVASLDFGTLDNNFGPGTTFSASITNTGSSSVMVGPLSIAGTHAADFMITSSTAAVALAAGASMTVTLVFDPSGTGTRDAAVIAPTDDPQTGSVVVALRGTGGAFSYAQVDRIGIPALNTVFNHPPQFSKTDYNVASPMDDLATYTGLFETVLGAVGNADPSATAALLLPDALPVDMSAGTTSFATLTGRDLADDAVDVALTVTVGPMELHSDNVDANDVPFLGSFPYLAAPNN